MKDQDDVLRPVAEALAKMDNQSRSEALIKMQRYTAELIQQEEGLNALSDEELEQVITEWVGDDELKKAAWLSAARGWASRNAGAAKDYVGGVAGAARDKIANSQRLAGLMSRARGARDAVAGIYNRYEGAAGELGAKAGYKLTPKGSSRDKFMANATRGYKAGKYGARGLAIGAGAGAAGAAGAAGYAAYNRKADEAADLQKGFTSIVEGAKKAGRTAGVVINRKMGRRGRGAVGAVNQTFHDMAGEIANVAESAKTKTLHAAGVAENAVRTGAKDASEYVGAIPGRIAASYRAVEDAGASAGRYVGGKVDRSHPMRGMVAGGAAGRYAVRGATGLAGAGVVGGAGYGAYRGMSGHELSEAEREQRRAAGRASGEARRRG